MHNQLFFLKYTKLLFSEIFSAEPPLSESSNSLGKPAELTPDKNAAGNAKNSKPRQKTEDTEFDNTPTVLTFDQVDTHHRTGASLQRIIHHLKRMSFDILQAVPLPALIPQR